MKIIGTLLYRILSISERINVLVTEELKIYYFTSNIDIKIFKMRYRMLNSTWILQLYNTIVISLDVTTRRNGSKTLGTEHVSSQGNNFTQK